MIRTDRRLGLAAVAAVAMLAGCQRMAQDRSEQAPRPVAGSATGEGTVQPSAVADAAPVPAAADLARTVLEKTDISVNGAAACALTVRYGDGEPQPVTWQGEGCRLLVVRLSSIEDLRRIGQDGKLSEESLGDLARMPGKRALYIEGSHSSALYPQNVEQLIYAVPLAD